MGVDNQSTPPIEIPSLRGGMDDTTPSHLLPDDTVPTATNVEWFVSGIGERRGGADPLDLTGVSTTPFNAAAGGACVKVKQWFPSGDVTQPELFAIFANPGNPGVQPAVYRRSGASSGTPQWFQVALANYGAPNWIFSPIPDVFNIDAHSLNGKLFWAYNGGLTAAGAPQDRLHLWDGSAWRPTGLTQPQAPTAADDGNGGSYTGARFYRVRYISQNAAGVVIRRSEPSTSISFTPVGSNAGVTVSRPVTINEGETHWELEASTDNANFYRIDTTPVAQASLDDTVATTAYTGFVLSEAIGAYLLQRSWKFVASDGDRLLGASHWTDSTAQSTVYWSPRLADPGVGNDERQPIVATGGLAIQTSKVLDNYDGGGITGITSSINGAWYVFKWSRIYKMVPSQDVTNAYDALTLSPSRGAIPGSIFEGVDELGAACIYFLDPVYGPSRISLSGLQDIYGLHTTWKRVNLKAKNKIAVGKFYPFKHQAIWHVAADGNDSPTLGIAMHVDELQTGPDGSVAHAGYSLWTGKRIQGTDIDLYYEWVSDGGNITLSERPFVALPAPDYILRTDVNTTDNGTNYSASITTKPYLLTGLLNKWGAMMATLLANANSAATIFIRLIRDFGVETSAAKSVSLAPAGTETQVIKDIDDLVMADARAIQVQFSDS